MTTPEKIAAAALKWAAAERAKKLTKLAFNSAWDKCHHYPEESEVSYPLFERRCGEGVTGLVENWFYVETDRLCHKDPLWIAQRMAWLEYKAAVKYAGICRAALTRMCNRVNAEGGK